MPYPYYNNNQFYAQNLQDLQSMREKIDRQMQQIQQFNQNQMQQQQPAPITQNFQIAPNPTNNELESKYVNNIDDVRNTFVMKTGIFLNKDFTNLWVKNTNGDIKTFTLEEVVEIDPKDKEIQMLKRQIEEMKGMISNESNGNSADFNGEHEIKNAPKLQNSKRTNAKSS